MSKDEKIAMFTTLSRIECLIMAMMKAEYGNKEAVRVHKEIAKTVARKVHSMYEEEKNERKRGNRRTEEPKTE